MKLFAVVPDEFIDPNLSAVFSTHKKAQEYVTRQGFIYQLHIFESEVIGDYELPNEVFVAHKHDIGFLDGGVEDIEIFTTSPEGMIFPEEFQIDIEQHIPDSQEHVFVFNNLVLTKEDLTEAIGITAKEIKNVKRGIRESTDLIQKKKLQRVLKGLQCQQLWQMENLERL